MSALYGRVIFGLGGEFLCLEDAADESLSTSLLYTESDN